MSKQLHFFTIALLLAAVVVLLPPPSFGTLSVVVVGEAPSGLGGGVLDL